MKINLMFDIDDTVYDQMEPFRLAFEENFPEHFGNVDIATLYKNHRYFSDLVFADLEKGKLDLWEMRIYRITEALKVADIKISQEQALAFEKSYSYFLQHIQLDTTIREVLELGRKHGIKMGIITNGPSDRQRGKINQLGLKKWIPENNWFISGEVKLAKPDQRLFKYAEAKLEILPQETIYIGDSFENDVIGAKRAGWQVIWLNHRNRQPENSVFKPDYTLTDTSELLEIIRELLR